MTHTVLICLGSNVEERAQRISSATERLGRVVHIIECSQMHESADVSHRGKPYLNMVLRCTCETDFPGLRERIVEIERAEGRTPESKATARMPIDIDIVVWDGEIISVPDYCSEYFNCCMGDFKP